MQKEFKETRAAKKKKQFFKPISGTIFLEPGMILQEKRCTTFKISNIRNS